MRVKFIDVLKAVAIIAVLLYHAGFLTYGYLGVDLFLVINGYFITMVLERKWNNSIESGTTPRFWKGGIAFLWDRVLRLLPVLLIAGLFCIIWGYFVMLPDEYENIGESVIATNLFSNNILQSIVSDDYWDLDNNYKPLMHTWYVGILMQFYVVFYLIYYFSKKCSKKYNWLISSLWILGGASLLLFIGVDDLNFRFYYLPCRYFEFAAGSLVFLYTNKKNSYKIPPIVSLALYVILIALLFTNYGHNISAIKLIAVVWISSVLLMSAEYLEKSILKSFTANKWIALIGAASYSLFVWHQVVIAYTRYSFTIEFSAVTFIIMILFIALLSTLSYIFVEKLVSKWVKSNKKRLSIISILGWFIITGMAIPIYLKAGVFHDVPELDIVEENARKGLHAEFNRRADVYYYRPFETNKPHWLIIGNSFANDWANTILESEIRDKVELSIIRYTNVSLPEYQSIFQNADKVFISMLGVDEDFVDKVLSLCILNGLSKDQLYVVGEKDFGANYGQIYWNKGRNYYYNQTAKMDDGFLEKNERLKKLYKDNFVDLIGLVLQNDGTVLVFTDDKKYISQDTGHFTRSGAKFFARIIDWSVFFK